ncbi:UDP-N-acetylmuramoyl-tripeptide--D-alanyl-D-alanine ligase, partial [bacterium]|nr:UDP-N-acetylmuramoyl-tripeptide--D-alanyl-D-alanine ligase [bacterium]
MEKVTVAEIVEASQGDLIAGDLQLVVPNISIDSRTIKEGELFLALKGRRYDGHDFLGEALGEGAMGAIVGRGRIHPTRISERHPFARLRTSKCRPYNKFLYIQVSDTLKALQDIAHYYRKKFDLPIVAVTGSNGKTTTKDMIAGILSKRLHTLKAQSSFNNHVGVSLTLLHLSSSHQAAVLEIGMSAPGEIAQLAGLVEPTMGVITNVGPAHLELFTDIEEIAEAKGELVDSLSEKGTVILNRDDDRVWAMAGRVKGNLISFGIRRKADFQATEIRCLPDGRSEFTLNGEVRIKLPLLGYVNIYNAVAAAGACSLFRLDLSVVKEGLESFKGPAMRMQILSLGKVKVINDAYNANPESMKMALQFLSGLHTGGRKIAVLGDMLELGKWGKRMHRELG